MSASVSARTRGLRNQILRWGVPGVTPGNPISTLPFEKNQIFRGANHISDAFQLRFSFVSASFNTLEIKKIAEIFL